MAKRPTMDDVAREADVSQATVSMVLNDARTGRVSDETAERVRRAAMRLGYRTNMHAKVLREGRAQMIGLIGDEVATSPFAGAMILGAQQQAWKRGYVLLTVDTAGSTNLEGAAIEMLQSYRVAGVLYAAMYHRILEVPRSLRTGAQSASTVRTPTVASPACSPTRSGAAARPPNTSSPQATAGSASSTSRPATSRSPRPPAASSATARPSRPPAYRSTPT